MFVEVNKKRGGGGGGILVYFPLRKESFPYL